MANLITNGGFEQGPDGDVVFVAAGESKIPNWTVVTGDVDMVITGVLKSAAGTRSLDLNGNGPGKIKQTMTTVAGKKYNVKFKAAGNMGGGDSPAIKTFKATAGSVTQNFNFDTAGKTSNNMGWVEKTFSFTATSASTDLIFESTTNGKGGPMLDEISVEEDTTPVLDYSILPSFATRQRYRVTALPKYAHLAINGSEAKVGDEFTQDDINKGRVQIVSDLYQVSTAVLDDSFSFVMLDGGKIVKGGDPVRSKCMPDLNIAVPADGVYKFPIKINVTPIPRQITNKPATAYSGCTILISRDMLEWGNERSTSAQETYTLNTIAKGTLLRLNSPIAVGGTFSQEDIDTGKISFTADKTESGLSASFTFTVCNQIKCFGKTKCVTGSFNINIKPWPKPVIKASSVTILECDGKELGTTDLNAYLTGQPLPPEIFGNAPDDDILFTFDGCTAKTPPVNKLSKIRITVSGSAYIEALTYPDGRPTGGDNSDGGKPKFKLKVTSGGVETILNDAQVVEAEWRSPGGPQWKTYEYVGDWGMESTKTLEISYINNDKTAEGTYKDRNLYVKEMELNGKKFAGSSFLFGMDPAEGRSPTETWGGLEGFSSWGGMYVNSTGPLTFNDVAPPQPDAGSEGADLGMEPVAGSNPRVRLEQCKFTLKELKAGKVKIADVACETSTDLTPSHFPFKACYKQKCTNEDICVSGDFVVYFRKKPIVTVPMPQDFTYIDGCIYQNTDTPTQSAGNQAETIKCGEFAVAIGTRPPQSTPVGGVVYVPRADGGPKTVVKLPDGSFVLLPNTPTKPDSPGEFPPVDPNTGQPPAGAKKFTGEDGTKWIKGTDGKWHPVAESIPPGGPNEDPIIRGFPHTLDVPVVSDAPAGTPRVYVPSIGRDVVIGGTDAQPTYFAEGNLQVNPMFWSGPNEFWFGYGQTPILGIFGNLGFIRINPMGMSIDGERYVPDPRTGGQGRVTYYTDLMGLQWNSYLYTGFSNALGADIPARGGWLGQEQSTMFVLKMPGNRLMMFSRTFLNLSNRLRSPPGQNGVPSDTFIYPNSYPLPYDYRSNIRGEIDSSNSTAAGPAGSQIPYWMWWHVNGSQAYQGSKGWRHSAMRGIDTLRDTSPYARPEAINLTWPTGPETMEIPLQAVDLTGKFSPIQRTFRLHWSANGRSPNGRQAEVTDNFGLDGGGPGPVPASLHCKFQPGRPGKEGDCYRA